MKNKFVKGGVAVVMAVSTAVLGLCGCSSENDENRVKTSDDLLASVQKSESSPEYDFKNSAEQPEGYDSYINTGSALALKMLKTESYQSNNTVVAPLSVTLSLSALENGMSNNTLKQVKGFLGKSNYTTDTINQCSAYISQRMSFLNTEDTGIFNVGSMWVSDSISPKRSFLQKYDNFYDIFAYKTDFSNENTNTVISNLILDNSNSLIQTDSIKTNADYKLYLDCSVAVSDVWLKSYSEDDVTTGTFAVNDKESANVTYLTSVERTFKTNKAQGFIKDLKNTPCKLVCILPNSDYTLEDYVENLTYDQLLDMPASVSATDFANVSIPEFSVTNSGSIKENLTKIGLDSIFSSDADFSKGFSEDIFVDDITQAVSITVNKNGISAENGSGEEAEKHDVEQSIKFDRPFLYAVVDNESYIPIIIGTVNNPEK